MSHDEGMRVRREVLGDEHVDARDRGDDGRHRRLPGPDHALRVGRDLGAAGPRPAHAERDHADGARRAEPRARAARCTSEPRFATGSPARRSRRCCSRARSTAASPRRTARSRCSRRSCGADEQRRLSAHPGRHRRAPGRPGSCLRTCCTCAASTRSCSRRAAASTSSTGSAPACSSRARSTCSTRWASATACDARGPRPRGHRAAVRRRAPPDRLPVAHRRPHDHRLRPAGGRQGPDRRAARRRGGRCSSRSRTCALARRRVGTPSIRFLHEGDARELACDFVAGCDGYHGVCRDAIPAGVLTRVLARVPVRAGSGSSPRRRPPTTS